MSLPPIELLESVHTFPGPYTFKVIANNEPGVIERILAAAREVVPPAVALPYHQRESEKGSHLSVTLEPVVESATQIHEIYQRLVKVPGVRMLL